MKTKRDKKKYFDNLNTYKIAETNCNTANDVRFGAKLDIALMITARNIEPSMAVLLPLVSANHPQKYDVSIIAEIKIIKKLVVFLNVPLGI